MRTNTPERNEAANKLMREVETPAVIRLKGWTWKKDLGWGKWGAVSPSIDPVDLYEAITNE
jgi:hypothetical protein